MAEAKVVKKAVDSIIEDLTANESKRFSKADFQTLVYGVLSDKNFKAKKFLIKNDEIVTEEYSINTGMNKFLDKLLKHAGMSDAGERAAIIETFEYSPKDTEWVMDAVDEAMYIYTDCDKNMRMFRDKMLQLTIKKMVRTGKFDGQVTYKKMVADRAKSLQKKLNK